MIKKCKSMGGKLIVHWIVSDTIVRAKWKQTHQECDKENFTGD